MPLQNGIWKVDRGISGKHADPVSGCDIPCLLFPEKYAGKGRGWKVYRETDYCDHRITFVERNVTYGCQRIFVF